MSEMKGALLSLLIFLFFIFPLLLSTGLNSVQQHAFIKTTTEFADIVKNEGGVTGRVDEIVDQLEARGYTITFSATDGSPVIGAASYGDMLRVHFVYAYQDVRGIKSLESQTVIPVFSR